jgi:hypothetical protein
VESVLQVEEFYKTTMSKSETAKDNLTLHVGTVLNISAKTTIVGDVRTSEQHDIHIHMKCNPIIAAVSFSIGALLAIFISLIKKATCKPLDPSDTTKNYGGKKPTLKSIFCRFTTIN